jgi:hypothetical protein
MNKGQMIARGRTAEVYEWNDGYVLKLFYDWCPTDWCSHEADVAMLVGQQGLSTPKCISTTRVDGRSGIIYERADGTSMLKMLSKNPIQIRKQAKLFAELHVEINSHSGKGLPKIRSHLQNSVGEVASISHEMKTKVLTILSELPDGDSLCHFDLHPDQVLINEQGPVVLDWITAVQGNPLADVARTLLLLQFGHAPHMSWIMRQALNVVRRAFAASYLRRYLELYTDADTSEIWKWMIPIAAARLKDGIKEEEPDILSYLRSQLVRYEGRNE